MQYIHIQKNTGHTPRKMRLVADGIKKMAPERALERLHFVPHAAAYDLAKVIKTALANAKGGQSLAKGGKQLTFKSIEVNEGMKMKRYRVGTAGRGRNRPYKKRLSHVKIVLTDEIKIKDKKLNIVKGKEVSKVKEQG